MNEEMKTEKENHMDYMTTLLEVIKRKLVEVEGKDLEFGNGESRTRQLYYLKRLEDNLVVPMSDEVRAMYERGDGNELDWKMCAVRSSAAMTFNLFGNGPVKFAYGEEFNLAYEHRLQTLRNNSRPANIDAYLYDEDEDIYCEMKMLEWLEPPRHTLSPAYLKAENYSIVPEDAGKFIELFGRLAAGKDGESELVSNERYDGLQMAKHLLAIYANMTTEEYKPKVVTLLNCVWELANPDVLGCYNETYLDMKAKEHEGFEKFEKSAAELIAPLFEAKGVCLSIEYETVAELMESIDYDKAHRAKLERYVI